MYWEGEHKNVRVLEDGADTEAYLAELEAEGKHHVAEAARRAFALEKVPTPPFDYLGTDVATGKSILEFRSESDAYEMLT